MSDLLKTFLAIFFFLDKGVPPPLIQAPRHLGSSQSQKCNILPYIIVFTSGLEILPHVDPKMSSLGHIEAKITPK